MIGDDKAAPKALQKMKASPYNFEDTKWIAFQNHDLGHYDIGHLMFLAVGSKNTFTTVPQRMPDSQLGIGWRYVPVGQVDLNTGEIKEI
jgi:hypothetical protein